MMIICLFIPAFCSTIIDYKLNKIEKINITDFICKYIPYLFVINLIMNSILWIFAEDKLIIYSSSIFSYSFCIKYMWLSLVLIIVIPLIKTMLQKHVDIQITLKKKRKK